MSLREFIRKHRRDIDSLIEMRGARVTNDKQRRDWVKKDISLHNWAIDEGVFYE